MGFLTEIVAEVRRDLDRRPLPEASLQLHAGALPPARDLEAAIRVPGLSVIAEVKRSSPSAGLIGDVEPGAQAAIYESAGAAAVSVLTEPRHFGGSLADLRAARMHAGIPILRKDFIVHPAQVVQSRAEGADAILLIAAALSVSELEDLRATAEDLGMAALVEAHSDADLDKAVASGARIVGVNSRDLESLAVDTEAALELAGRVPGDRAVVVESGIATRDQAAKAEAAGAHAILVGEALMRSANPTATLRGLLGR